MSDNRSVPQIPFTGHCKKYVHEGSSVHDIRLGFCFQLFSPLLTSTSVSHLKLNYLCFLSEPDQYHVRHLRFRQIRVCSYFKGTPHRWQSGLLARLPWRAILSLLGALLGVAGPAAFLVYSSQSPVSDWEFQPTVYLAIVSTLTNILLHLALSEGANVAWRVQAVTKPTF